MPQVFANTLLVRIYCTLLNNQQGLSKNDSRPIVIGQPRSNNHQIISSSHLPIKLIS